VRKLASEEGKGVEATLVEGAKPEEETEVDQK